MSLSFENLSIPDLEGYTILIVDDNPTNLGVVSDYLEEYGFNILIARNGENGIRRAQYVKPDIILLDVMMPGMDGFETCQHLKTDKATADIPIIFMTALSSAENKVKGFQSGAVDYVTKPLQHEEVLARVTTHLRIRDLTQSLQTQNTQLQKVTNELQTAYEDLSKRAIQLETNNKVGQQVTSILNLNALLAAVVDLIQGKFGYYFIGIWLINEAKDTLILQARMGQNKEHLPETGFRITIEGSNSIIVWVVKAKKAYLANDTHIDSRYLVLEELPDTQSELALPLLVGDQIIGVLDIQSDGSTTFDREDQTVLQTLANQIAIAIRNARLYESEKKLRRIEEERAQDLADLNASKDKFFSIVSHDLRGPFSSLMGHSQLILMALDNLTKKDIKDMTQHIYDAAKTAHNLLENLLTWSRMERGHMEYLPGRVPLEQLVQSTVDLLAETANSKKIKLANAVERGMFIYVDWNMIDTVIRNLTANAIKFTPDNGEITISAQETETDSETQTTEKFVTVSVSDTGVGISEEDIDKLFRIDTHHTTRGTAQEQGTGLGLIICHEMVENNGGRIWAESEVGHGTTIKFTVPLDVSADFLAVKQQSDIEPDIKKITDSVGEKDVSTFSRLDMAPDQMPIETDNLMENDAFFTQIIPPPSEELAILLDLAMMGNLQEMKERALQLKKRDEKFTPFADELTQLASNFEDEQILVFVERYITKN